MITASDLFKTAAAAAGSVARMSVTLNGLSIAVADMAASLAFYRRLGLDFPPEADREPHAEVELPGGFRVMFDSAPEFPPHPGGPSLAFRCDTPAEVDKLHAELVAAGYVSKNEPWDAFWGQRYAVMSDPDGYQVDLFCWLK